MTLDEYICRHPSDQFVAWRRHEELVFKGSGKDYLEGTAVEDLKLPISEPIEVGPCLRVFTLVAAGDIWFYYHETGRPDET